MKKLIIIYLLFIVNGILYCQDSLDIQKLRFDLSNIIQLKYSNNHLFWNIPDRYKENHPNTMDLIFHGFDEYNYQNINDLISQIKTVLNRERLTEDLNLPINASSMVLYKCSDTFLQELFRSGILDTTLESITLMKSELKSFTSLVNQKKIVLIEFLSCSIKELPAEIEKMQFEFLILDDFDSLSLTNKMNKLNGLRDLYLNNIRHLVIDDSFSLPYLNVLGIKLCSENICHLVLNKLNIFPNLKFLGIYDTKLDSLPSSITTLKHLKRLGLEGVGISKLPDFLCEFKKLISISLINLPIKTIPRCLSEISGLSHIQITDTPLLRLSEDLLQEFKRKKIQLILDDGIK